MGEDQLLGRLPGESLRQREKCVEPSLLAYGDQDGALRRGYVGQVERAIMSEHGSLELLESRAEFDPELLYERGPSRAEGRERVGLPSRAVEREHQLDSEALAERLRGDKQLQLPDQLGMTSEREVGVDPPLEGREAQLLQPADRSLGERLAGQLAERRSAPEGKGRAESLGRLPRL